MKRLLVFLLFLPLLATASVDITNIPLGGFAMTDTLLGVTNANWAARGTVQDIAGTATNGWPWTNLTVAHAGAVTNGYPWTNVPVAAASTVPIAGVTTPGAILTNGNSFAVNLSNNVFISGGDFVVSNSTPYGKFAYTNATSSLYVTGLVQRLAAGGINTLVVTNGRVGINKLPSNASFEVDIGGVATDGPITLGSIYGISWSSRNYLYARANGVQSLLNSSLLGNNMRFVLGLEYSTNSAIQGASVGAGTPALKVIGGDGAGTCDLWVNGAVTATNGVYQMVKPSFTTNFTCTTNLQTYLLNGGTPSSPQVITLPNAANVPNVIYRFSSTNDACHYILTNSTGAQTIADGSSLAYTNSGSGKPVVALLSDGAHWWLMGKAKTRLPCAQFSTDTNTTFANITNTVTLKTTDMNNNLGIGLDNSAWFTAGVGSRIYCTNLGTYMLTISAVWAKTSATAENGDIWLRQSGVDVPGSMTLMSIQNSSTNVMTVNFLMSVVTNDTFFDFQAASTGGNGQLQAMPAITSPFNRPACPSVIVTVNKVSD